MPGNAEESCEGNVAVDKPKKGTERHLGKDLGQSTGGFDLVLTGVVFALAGLWLDRRFGLTPLLTIVLTVVGFVGAVLNIYYRYIRDIEKLEAEAAALRSGNRPQASEPASEPAGEPAADEVGP